MSLFICTLLTGCASGEGSSKNTTDSGNEPAAESESPEPIEKSQDADAADLDAENDTVELKIYTINYDTQEVEDAVTDIPADEEVSCYVVANAVVESIVDYGIDIELNDAVAENENAIVDFKGNENGSGISDNISKKVEETVLDCISYSILDNVPNVQGIIFRIDGQEYKTDNFSFTIDQVYTWK